MPIITYYRQQRMDDSIRSGIEIEGSTVLGRIEVNGKENDTDPTLTWYVDVRCQVDTLSNDPEEVRQWFLDKGELIRKGLKTLAGKIKAGIDYAAWPLRWDIPKTLQGTRISIVCCAVRRSAALRMSRILNDIEAHWEERIRQLAPLLSYTE